MKLIVEFEAHEYLKTESSIHIFLENKVKQVFADNKIENYCVDEMGFEYLPVSGIYRVEVEYHLEEEVFTEVSISDEKTVHFAEHEIYMSFTDDEGAEAFEEWWNEAGALNFQQWINKHKYYEGLKK